jgi:D-3-phosphoglycerate dehydrogenase / 2-oxoglutarate reductase
VIGAVTHFYPLSERQLDRWPGLQFVATVRSGIENIDRHALDRRSVPLLRNTGRNANAVAEFAVAAMLAQLRRIGEGHHLVRTGQWRPAVPLSALRELSELTVGLIGCGAVGSRVARRLSGFEPRLLINDPWLAADAAPPGAALVPLDRLLAEADIISVHARSSPDTFHLLGPAELDLVRPDAVIINTARAELIDEEALIDRLRDGRIGGAVLDVFSVEPLPADHTLRSLPNVTLSPHVAGLTLDARTNAPRLIARRIADFLNLISEPSSSPRDSPARP